MENFFSIANFLFVEVDQNDEYTKKGVFLSDGVAVSHSPIQGGQSPSASSVMVFFT